MELPCGRAVFENGKETTGFLNVKDFLRFPLTLHPYSSYDIFTFRFLVSQLRKAKKAFLQTILERGCEYMGIFDPDEVITIYSLRQAIDDGVLIEVFKREWYELSGGKPIAASMNVYEGLGFADLVEIWNRFVFWRIFVMPRLGEKKRIFSTEIDYHTIWVVDEGVFFMMIYLEDY